MGSLESNRVPSTSKIIESIFIANGAVSPPKSAGSYGF
jgi:hypothetical protein